MCKMYPLYLVQWNQHCVWLENGAILPHCKHLENPMTKLSGSIADISLLTYSLSSALMTSHWRHSWRLSLNWSEQSLVLGSKCRRRSLTKASMNGVVALNAWYSRMGAISNIRLKMICNDFLVVKVNCWSYVFNIMKYMSSKITIL